MNHLPIKKPACEAWHTCSIVNGPQWGCKGAEFHSCSTSWHQWWGQLELQGVMWETVSLICETTLMSDTWIRCTRRIALKLLACRWTNWTTLLYCRLDWMMTCQGVIFSKPASLWVPLFFCFRWCRPCPEVQQSHWHMSCWRGGSICTFPSVPLGCLARQQHSQCVVSHLCVRLVRQSFCLWAVFFFFLFPVFDTQCLFTPFSLCHGSWSQHTQWLVLLREWSPQWRDQHGDGDR